MEENTSTTDGNNPSDDSAAGTTTDADSTTSTDTNGTGENTNNSDPSKSTEETTADGDNKPADGSTEDTSTSTKIDEDIDDWASKKGLPEATTDEQRAAYQATRDEQREFTRAQQAKREEADAKTLGDEVNKLKPEVTEDDDDELDPNEKRIRDLELKAQADTTTRLQSEFYINNKVTEAENKAILDLIKEKVARPTTPELKLKAFDFWSSPDALPDLLDLAKARISNSVGTSTVADEAARQEREKMERESHANSPGPGARTHSDGKLTPEQERSKRFDNWD